MRSLPSRLFLGLLFCLVGALPYLPAQAAIFRIPPSTDPYWQRQWYLRQIEAPEAWQLIPTSTKEIVVAVIDAGVDDSHPDLKDAMWTNPGEIPSDGIDNDRNGYIDDIHGWNFVDRSADTRPEEITGQPEEAWSHGTFVSSLIAARSIDHPGMLGVNQDARIMALEALDGDGYGGIPAVLDAMRYAINNGASVINLSLAGDDDNAELQQMMQHAHDMGVVVVAATGNGRTSAGNDIDQRPIYPACFDGSTNLVIGVSATDAFDQHAAYANYGRTCTDLSAPGRDMFGARPSYPRVEDRSSRTEKYLDGMSGTSLAAPLVSGAASLLKAVRPDLTVDQLHQILVSTTDSIEQRLEPSQMGKMGSGRLNVRKALTAALMQSWSTGSLPKVLSPTVTSTLESGDALSFFYQASSTQLRWIVAPKPLWQTWSSSGTTPIVLTFGKEGKDYVMKRWNPTSMSEQTTRIIAPKGQTWTTLVASSSSAPAWLVMSSKREFHLVRPQDQKVTTLTSIKGLSSQVQVTWDTRRQSWVVRDTKTKKSWAIGLTGTIRSL